MNQKRPPLQRIKRRKYFFFLEKKEEEEKYLMDLKRPLPSRE